jgi:hypothetical protein
VCQISKLTKNKAILWSLGYKFHEILYLGVQFWYNLY